MKACAANRGSSYELINSYNPKDNSEPDNLWRDRCRKVQNLNRGIKKNVLQNV